ncbi:MAG: hypothetical protein WCS95_06885 [Lentisphaeria bacterium]|nr:hypothetical protein [Lentisphaeria bacterium]NLZ59244.1 hypothetical protein [Lentisphaerota bacterium]
MTEAGAHTDDRCGETLFLLLRSVPYQGGSIIVSGITPQLGQMGFFVRLPSGKGKDSFPVFDLFRLLRINYKRGKGELFYSEAAECLAEHSRLSQDYRRFQCACWLAKFSLANTMPELAQPQYFCAMQVALQRLSAKVQSPAAVLTGVCLTFLLEAGLLDVKALSAQELTQCTVLLEMAAGGDMPVLQEENWQQLWLWCYRQLQENECILPALER